MELARGCEVAEQVRAFAAEPGSHEDEQLVDEVAFEERGRERRAALEQQALHALRAERGQLLAQRPRAQLELRALRQRTTADREPPRLPRRLDSARIEPRRVGVH